jgi:nanoRNase/pAp phosphatase (c-di-AMP/oligoRNAs hydrolase)
MAGKKFRLVTRSDFDGLVCAVLLKELDLIDEIKFVHPKDMQDGLVDIDGNDITTNLPYVDGVHLAFDHHSSETIRVGEKDNHIIDPDAPSAARVVYKYYGGDERFANINKDMMDAVDRGDSANFSQDQVLNPEGWDLMNFLMDARTGLGRFRDFSISNYQLMMKLIDLCKDHSIEDIMQDPDVKERADLYMKQQVLCISQINKCAKVYKNIVVLDLREEETIYTGNRFIIYALFPEQNISIHVMWGLKKQNTVFATGKSIFNKTSKTNIGELMLRYGGGGHKNAGTCQVANEKADETLRELIISINADG